MFRPFNEVVHCVILITFLLVHFRTWQNFMYIVFFSFCIYLYLASRGVTSPSHRRCHAHNGVWLRTGEICCPPFACSASSFNHLFIMAALWNRAGRYIFVLWFLLSSSSFFLALSQQSQSGCLPYFLTLCGLKCEFRMQVWNVLHAASWKCRTQKSPKIRHLRTVAQLCRAISSQQRHVSTVGKKSC